MWDCWALARALHGQAAILAVVDKADGRVSLIDLATLMTTGIVPVGYRPHEIAVTPDAQYAFVTNYGHEFVTSDNPLNRPGNTVSVVDLRRRLEIGRIDFGRERCEPYGVAVSANGDRLYVTCEARNGLLSSTGTRARSSLPFRRSSSIRT